MKFHPVPSLDQDLEATVPAGGRRIDPSHGCAPLLLFSAERSALKPYTHKQPQTQQAVSTEYCVYIY